MPCAWWTRLGPDPLRLLLGAGVLGTAALLSCSGLAPLGGEGEGGASTTTTTTTGTAPAGGSGGEAGAPSAGGQGGDAGHDPWDPVQSLTEVDLGTFEVGGTLPNTFTIPDRTLGFTLLATAPAIDQIVGWYQLKPPSGSSVIYNFAMAYHSMQSFANLGWCACANPQSDTVDAWPVKQGLWDVRVGSDGSVDSAEVTLWVRRTLDGDFHGGVVDVNLFVAAGTASTAYLDTVLDDLFPYAGLELGTVQHFSLDSSYLDITTYDQYQAMLRTSDGVGTEPAVNLFVVGDFSGDFGGAIGVAGGIPGSPMRHGTSRSGVAYQPSGSESYDALVLAHEIGHLAGLFHTTEIQIAETDPLSDTETCPPNTMQSDPGSCPDADNIMFPIAYGGTEWSEAQLIVVEGSTLYRGILEDGGQPAAPLPMASPRAVPPPLAAHLSVGRLPTPPPRTPQDQLERLLSAVWCSRAGDNIGLVAKIAAADGARLRELALDVGAFDLVRARALRVLARLTQHTARHADTLDLSEAVLGSGSAGRSLATSALEILHQARPRVLPRLAKQIPRGRDAVVDATLTRFGVR